MHADRVPSQAPPPSDVYRAYVAVLPQWLRRFGVPSADVADLMQEVWLAVCRGSVPLPNNIRDARFELFKLTRVVARRLRRLHEREACQLAPEINDGGHDFVRGGLDCRPASCIDGEEMAEYALGVFEAFERLAPEHQRLARDYYVFGYTLKEMAQRADVPEDRMEKWVWRVRAELEKLAQADERLERRAQKRRNGALIVPFAFDLDPANRAAFCSIWEVEEGPTELGGGGGGARPPARTVFPVAPVVSGVSAFAVAAVGLALLIVMLLLFPVSLVALEHLWKPPQVETAQSGLRVPPLPEVSAVDEVVPAYPVPLVPNVQPPAARPSRKSIPVKDEPSSGPAFERGGTD